MHTDALYLKVSKNSCRTECLDGSKSVQGMKFWVVVLCEYWKGRYIAYSLALKMEKKDAYIIKKGSPQIKKVPECHPTSLIYISRSN